MPKKTGLGRGLDALIPKDESVFTDNVIQISINIIDPNPRQPRSEFNEEEMEELAASIHEHGIIQPVILSRGEKPGRYTLIAGQRRLSAARQAGLETVPSIIRDVSEQQSLELALIENLQRADLNPLEAADAYRQLADDFELSHQQISTRVGKSRTTITNTMRLLNLPEKVQQALINADISEGHARTLLSLSTHQSMSAALKTILTKKLNVRQTEDLVRKMSGKKVKSPGKPPKPPEIIAIEERLRMTLGTKVNLNQRKKGGSIVIHYYSEEELNSLLDQIMGEI